MAAEDRDLNRDPLSDEQGSHPVGTGVGAAGGAVAGAAVGAVGGPVGMAAGGVVGAIIGGLAGRAAAEAVNPSAEEAYWRENYDREPYHQPGRSFDDYGPAYRHGLEARSRYDDWAMAEPELSSQWETRRGSSSLDWETAKPASRAAWDRVDPHYRGHSDAKLSHYGTGLTSTDSSYHTGGAVGEDTTAARATRATGAVHGEHDTVAVLKDLVEICLDGEYGFRECADHAKREDLRSMFLQRAEDCRHGAQQLQEQIRAQGGHVPEHGSVLGSVHRGWVATRAALTSYDDKAMLEEAERGEDKALAHYRKALQHSLPESVRQVVAQQCDGVQRNHDEVKRLRDQARMQG